MIRDGKTAFQGQGVEASVDKVGNWLRASSYTFGEPKRVWLRNGGTRYVVQVDPPPAKMAWKASASSFERGEGEPEHVLDGDTSTFWHTHWSGTAAKPPHSLVVDLNKPQTVGRLILTQRQGNHNGRILEYEVYLSDDGKAWGSAAAKGRLPDRDEPQTVRLAVPRRARYVKLVVLSDRTNGGWASLAEFDVRLRTRKAVARHKKADPTPCRRIRSEVSRSPSLVGGCHEN